MKKKIYLIRCEVYYEKYERRPFGRLKYIEKAHTCEEQGFVLASCEEDALKKAAAYYDSHTSTFDRIARNDCTYVEHATCAEGTLSAKEIARVNFDKLKRDMPSQDFLEYCKQEIYGLDEII